MDIRCFFNCDISKFTISKSSKKVILGRGLDIWQKTGGWYDLNEYVQEKRICKAYEATFLKNYVINECRKIRD